MRDEIRSEGRYMGRGAYGKHPGGVEGMSRQGESRRDRHALSGLAAPTRLCLLV